MARTRTETWLAVIVGAAGLVLMGMIGLWAYISLTSKPLHANPRDIPSVAQAPVPQWAAAVQQGQAIVRAHLTDRNLPGLSVAVAAGGDLVWAEGFGWADLDRRTKVEPRTRFRLGTASTALTSAAVGVLLEQRRLKLDEEIQTYVPRFPEQPWPVTLRQLMAHLAGVRNDGGDEGPLFSAHCERPVDALPFFAQRPLLFEPDTRFRYSSYGWILVSAAVEAAAHQPFLAFMQQHVFEPLGMDRTRADVISTDSIADRATPYFPRFAADTRYGPDPMRDVDYSCYAGSSVFQSTPSDLVRFARAFESGTLLKPETVQVLRTPQRLASGEETGYGLGWNLENVTVAGRPARAVGANGDVLGGMAASLMTFPEQRIVVAVMSNISYAETFSLAVKLAEPFASAR
jgi:serine beta-lactamase-like protein LACTB, mitochondrial